MHTRHGGLVIIGGHEDKVHSTILAEFIELAGGSGARVAVVTTATKAAEDAFDTYREAFRQLGAHVMAVEVRDRRDALADVDPRLREADGFFFVGGDQLRLTSVLGGTAVLGAIRDAHERGAAVGGTSAGASAMSATMIIEGRAQDAPRLEGVRMSPGFGFLEGVIIDQHFDQRGRASRLFSALAQNPSLLGLGIDENTAIVVGVAERTFRVVGEAAVTVVDGSTITLTTTTEVEGGAPLAIAGLTVHVLPDGFAFDLAGRLPIHASRGRQLVGMVARKV